MTITKGKSFRTIQEAMQTMFNRNIGSGQKPSYYVFKSGWAVWFPKAALPSTGGLLAPPPGQHWLNILSANGTEIIEVNTQPGSAGCGSPKGIKFPRAIFIKDGAGPYVFKGVYVLTSHSVDYRSRVYTKTAEALDTEAVTGEIEADESSESGE
jgi:hypothetical protein